MARRHYQQAMQKIAEKRERSKSRAVGETARAAGLGVGGAGLGWGVGTVSSPKQVIEAADSELFRKRLALETPLAWDDFWADANRSSAKWDAKRSATDSRWRRKLIDVAEDLGAWRAAARFGAKDMPNVWRMARRGAAGGAIGIGAGLAAEAYLRHRHGKKQRAS